MFLEFRIKNFKCFRDEKVFSMVATDENELIDIATAPIDSKEVSRVVLTSAIYGPNFSGKTVLLEAIDKFVRTIKIPDVPGASSDLPAKPFLFNCFNVEEPTEFECTVFIDHMCYQYGFSCTEKEIVEEYLYHFPDGEHKVIFERDRRGKEERICSEQICYDGIAPHSLLLTKLASDEHSVFFKIREFFKKVEVLFSDGVDWQFENVCEVLSKDHDMKKRILEMLKFSDIDIFDIWIRQKDGGYETLFLQKEDEVKVVFPKEMIPSSIILLIVRMVRVLKTIESGGIIFIDDFDTNTHTLLIRHLFEKFQLLIKNGNRGQLVAVMHDTRLLKDVGNIIRRDQIWFIEKDTSGSTDLFSLSQFKRTKNENPYLNYSYGRYGAVPVVYIPD